MTEITGFYGLKMTVDFLFLLSRKFQDCGANFLGFENLNWRWLDFSSIYK